ncbi:MAG: hypothetical protein WCS43_04985 [Verrucomicrobiota bacterium]
MGAVLLHGCFRLGVRVGFISKAAIDWRLPYAWQEFTFFTHRREYVDKPILGREKEGVKHARLD